MRIVSRAGPLVLGTASLAFLAGCAGGGLQAPTPTSAVSSLGQSVVSRNVVKGFVNVNGVNAPGGNQVIVSDSLNNAVSVFGAAGQLNALLTAGLSQPEGLATDAAQNLYVANGQSFDVLVYAKPYTTARLTLDDPGLYPEGVAVSPSGVVAVTSPVANPYGPGAVRMYAKGTETACATVSDPNWQGMQFGAFDASGRFFFDGYDRDGNVLVGEITGGCSAKSISTLRVGNTLTNPQGVQVQGGNVLILDQNYATFSPVIDAYAAPTDGSLGSPTSTTKLSAGIEMMTFALTADDNHLWIAHSDEAAGRIEYSYPGGRFMKSFDESSLGTAFGIAVNPAASP